MRLFNPIQRNAHIILVSRLDISDYINSVHEKIVGSTGAAIEDSFRGRGELPCSVETYSSILSESHIDTIVLRSEQSSAYIINLSTCGDTQPENAVSAAIREMEPAVFHSLYLYKKSLDSEGRFPSALPVRSNPPFTEKTSYSSMSYDKAALAYGFMEFSGRFPISFNTRNVSLGLKIDDGSFFGYGAEEKASILSEILKVEEPFFRYFQFPLTEAGALPGESGLVMAYTQHSRIAAAYHSSPAEGFVNLDVDEFSIGHIAGCAKDLVDRLCIGFKIVKREVHIVDASVSGSKVEQKIEYFQ